MFASSSSLRLSRHLLTSARLSTVSAKSTPTSTTFLYRQRLPARFFSAGIAVKMSDAPPKTTSAEESKPVTETIKEAVDAATSSVGAVIPSADTVQSTAESVQAQVAAAVPGTGDVKSATEPAQAGGEKPGVHNLLSEPDFHNAVNDTKPSLVVIDFFATWCGPCKVIAPQVVKFAQKYPNVRFYKVDVDDLPQVSKSKELNVRAMPTFVLFKNGNKVAVVVGANPKALEAAIKANLEGGATETANGANSNGVAPNGSTAAAAPAAPATTIS